MPAIQLLLIGFALGVWYAWTARDQLRRSEGAWRTPAGFVVGAFSTLVFAPACCLLCLTHADWSLGYLVSSGGLPNSWPVLMMLAYSVIVPLGFAVGSSRAKQSQAMLVTRLTLVPLAFAAALALLCVRPLSVVGTTQQYAGQFGLAPVAGSSLGYSLLWLSVVLPASVAWTLRLLQSGAKSFKEQQR